MEVKKKEMAQAIETRIAAIDTKLDLPEATRERMSKIRRTVQRCATDLYGIVQEGGNGSYDVGRFIHTIDLLWTVKDTTCAALILPQVGKRLREEKMLREEELLGITASKRMDGVVALMRRDE